MNKPNLFHYATSELSQDAFICWILSWAAPNCKSIDEVLHTISINILRAFFEKCNKTFPYMIEKIEIRKQYEGIDVLVIINDTISIPIEDKIHIREHSEQLKRYLISLHDVGFSDENIVPIYLQTGEQGDYSEVKKAGFYPFLRSEFLSKIREGINLKNEILTDFINHLEGIENKVTSFRLSKLEDWEWYSWQGFYNYLQDELAEGQWGYVANPRGGFLGFWWHWFHDNECEQYLQLEQNKLCFKISVDNPEKRDNLKWKWHQLILEAGGNSKIKIIKPVLRNGQCMTVAAMEGDYRQIDDQGKIDLEKTMFILHEVERILEKAIEM